MSAVPKKLSAKAVLELRESTIRQVPSLTSQHASKAYAALRKRALAELPSKRSKHAPKTLRVMPQKASRTVSAAHSKQRPKANGAVPIRARVEMPEASSNSQCAAFSKLPTRAIRVLPHIAILIDTLRENHRRRQDLHRAEKSLTLRIKAILRRLCAGDKTEAAQLYKAMLGKGEHPRAATALALCAPFLQARATFTPLRTEVEKQMDAAAKQLPVWPWAESIRGMGAASLAAIIGETGDLSNYATHSKLWKRFGLAVIDGERQRKVKGAEALKHGYSASRRSVMWNVGQCVFKAQSQRVDKETGEVKAGAGKYRLIYDARKEIELPRVPSKVHAHNRATRYMEKRLVRDLWKAWRAYPLIDEATNVHDRKTD